GDLCRGRVHLGEVDAQPDQERVWGGPAEMVRWLPDVDGLLDVHRDAEQRAGDDLDPADPGLAARRRRGDERDPLRGVLGRHQDVPGMFDRRLGSAAFLEALHGYASGTARSVTNSPPTAASASGDTSSLR